MHISCYKADETNFNHQGQFKIEVDEEENNIYRALNGQFYTTFKVPITDIFVENLVPRMIVKIPTPNKNNPMQLFRIVDYDEDDNGDIIFTAFHIAWDLSAGFLPHINIVGKTRKQSAEYILEKAKETQDHRFNIIDNDDPKEQKNLQIVRDSPLASLMGNKDNTLLNRYEGTEFDFDNFDIIISNRIGQDTGFLVKDNKNIITSNKNLDYKPIATRIIPQGSDELLLPEYYIDSPLINNYDTIFYKHVEFNEIGINEDEGINKNIALEMLREAARALFTQQNIDKPYLSWTINFDDMQDNEKVAIELRKLLKLDLGDSVIVSKNKLANRLNARILEYNYNFVKGKYKDITISNISKNFTVSLEQSVADINFKVDNFTSIISNINQSMHSKIQQTEKEILLEVNKKVGVDEVKTTIEQNPDSVKIGINKIDNRFEMTEDGHFFRDRGGKKALSLKRGYLHTYTNTDETLNSAIIPRTTSGNFGRGTSIVGANLCHFFSIGRDANWSNDEQITISPSDFFVVNFRDRGDDLGLKVGSHFYGGKIHAHNGLYATSISSGYYKNANGDDAFAIFSDVTNYKNWNWNGKNLVNANIVRSSFGLNVINNLDSHTRNSMTTFDAIKVVNSNKRINDISLDVSKVANKESLLINDENIDMGKLVTLLVKEIKEIKDRVNDLESKVSK